MTSGKVGPRSVGLTLQGWTRTPDMPHPSGRITITGNDAGKQQRWVWALQARAPASYTNSKGNWSPCGSNSSDACFSTPAPLGISIQAAKVTTSVTVEFVFDS